MAKQSTSVSIVKCSSYTQEEVDKAVEKSVSLLGGMQNFVRKGDKVLLKVNLLLGKDPSHAVTTHPAVVRAVIKLVRKAGGKPSVGDSPANTLLESFEKMAKASGFKQVCDELDVPLVELSDPEEIKAEGKIKEFKISRKLREYDVLINLPKLKTHSLTILTGASKNLFGCVSGMNKAFYHTKAQDPVSFSEMILELNKVVVPGLTIMDAIIGMEGDGPSAGEPRQIGLVIAGTSTLAIDSVAAEILGMKRDVPMLSIARSRNMREVELQNLCLLGESIDNVKIADFKRPSAPAYSKVPEKLKSLSRLLSDKKPVVDKEKCIGCASCFNVCPKKAIKMVGRKSIGKNPEFNYKLCIRCYCCMEVCPVKAISLKDEGLSALFRRRRK